MLLKHYMIYISAELGKLSQIHRVLHIILGSSAWIIKGDILLLKKLRVYGGFPMLVMCTHNLWFVTIFEEGALKETKESWDVLYMWMSFRHVEVQSDLCLILSSCNILISGTVS
jgi:hypothetical protein